LLNHHGQQDLRKAFKRIALLKHPDKNPSNPRAHDEFVAINTAFEALKDPETRRIYDRCACASCLGLVSQSV
jgi:DnaJ family protein C protein 10